MQLDSLKTASDTTHFILKNLEKINSNTDGFSNVWSGIISIISIMASIVTIIGLATLRNEMKRKRANYEFRKKIILDLIRHMMVNNSILEVIRSKMEKDNNYRPIEGVLQRFATLDSDIELGRFSMSAYNYEIIHNLSLKIRNYNSIVKICDKHIQNPEFTFDEISKELDDIFYRAVEISQKLIQISSDKLYWRITWSTMLTKFLSSLAYKTGIFKELTIKDIRHYIIESKYNKKWLEERKKENRYDAKFPIPNRMYEDKPCYAYYDEMGLGETFDHLIRHNASRF